MKWCPMFCLLPGSKEQIRNRVGQWNLKEQLSDSLLLENIYFLKDPRLSQEAPPTGDQKFKHRDL